MSIPKQIKYYKSKIQEWEDTDPAFLNDEIKDLRHKTLFIHLRLEATLELLIRAYTTTPLNHTNDKLVYAQYVIRSGKVYNALDFAKKIALAKDFGLIPTKLSDRLYKLNQIRIYFSHPSSYQQEIQQYNNKVEYLKALELLYKVFDEMNELLVKMFNYTDNK